jgi:peroxiredoxin
MRVVPPRKHHPLFDENATDSRSSKTWRQTMSKSEILIAPDFVLQDTRGHDVKLSDYRGKKHAVLVFTRGFA